MKITVLNKLKDAILIELIGELSIEEKYFISEKFENILKDAVKENIKKVDIEISKLEYIDSVGISFFISLKKNLEKENISLKLLNTPNTIIKIMKMLSLENFFDIN